jgi:hypothetical protein
MNKAQRKEFQLTREQFKILVSLPGYRGAGLHETMGPHYKDIYWSPKVGGSFGSPCVVQGMTREEVAAKLGQLAKR